MDRSPAIMHQLKITVGAIVFTIIADRSFEEFGDDGVYPEFINNELSGDLEVTLGSHYSTKPTFSLEDAELVFEGPYWTIHSLSGKPVFSINFGNFQPPFISQIAVLSPDFRQGDIYHFSSPPSVGGGIVAPLAHPLFQLLMVSLLAQGYGVLIHACGIDDHGKGLLFTGSSGYGKSTIARLWNGEGTVLSDERILIRQYDGRLWMFGTPWHGEYQVYAPYGVPLERVFFLNHASRNHITPRTNISTAASLATHCLFPAWDPKGMKFVLGFCGQVVNSVPCCDLGFVPDIGVIDFIRSTNA